MNVAVIICIESSSNSLEFVSY